MPPEVAVVSACESLCARPAPAMALPVSCAGVAQWPASTLPDRTPWLPSVVTSLVMDVSWPAVLVELARPRPAIALPVICTGRAQSRSTTLPETNPPEPSVTTVSESS